MMNADSLPQSEQYEFQGIGRKDIKTEKLKLWMVCLGNCIVFLFYVYANR